MFNNILLNKNIIFCLMIFLTIQLFHKNSFSTEPDEILQDSMLELKARNISKNLRCMICQNQSIDESNSLIAKDLRILIRKKLKDGESDKEIYNYLTLRYGDFILLKPPLRIDTYLLWFLPFIFLIIGILLLYYHNKKAINS